MFFVLKLVNLLLPSEVDLCSSNIDKLHPEKCPQPSPQSEPCLQFFAVRFVLTSFVLHHLKREPADA